MMAGSDEDDKEKEELKKLPQDKGLVKKAIPGSGLVKFDWNNKWLKGDEYHYILTHANLYIQELHFGKYPPKTHPISIYTAPISSFKRKNRR